MKVFCADCKYRGNAGMCQKPRMTFVPATYLRDAHWIAEDEYRSIKNASNDCPDYRPRLAIRLKRLFGGKGYQK